MAEGQFKSGQFEGYGRVLDNEGECKVGYWKVEAGVSRPCGKFAYYDRRGIIKQKSSSNMNSQMTSNKVS